MNKINTVSLCLIIEKLVIRRIIVYGSNSSESGSVKSSLIILNVVLFFKTQVNYHWNDDSFY